MRPRIVLQRIGDGEPIGQPGEEKFPPDLEVIIGPKGSYDFTPLQLRGRKRDHFVVKFWGEDYRKGEAVVPRRKLSRAPVGSVVWINLPGDRLQATEQGHAIVSGGGYETLCQRVLQRKGEESESFLFARPTCPACLAVKEVWVQFHVQANETPRVPSRAKEKKRLGRWKRVPTRYERDLLGPRPPKPKPDRSPVQAYDLEDLLPNSRGPKIENRRRKGLRWRGSV